MATNDTALYDKPWSRRKIEGLIKGCDWVQSPATGEWHSIEGDGWYGMKVKGYDSGNPDGILDCIQLEMAVGNISDRHEQAAVILRMFGWDEQDIGATLSSRRTGRALVEGGITAIKQYERSKGKHHG